MLVGDPRAFVAAFKTPGNDRKTDLADKICKQLGIELEENKSEQVKKQVKEEKTEKSTKKETEDYILTPEKIYSGEIDPMIGMENIKL